MPFVRSALASMLTISTVLTPFTVAYAMDDKQKEEMGAFIRQYLIDNPEVLIEAQQALETKREAARQEQAQKALTTNHDAIFNASYDLSLGNPKGKITIVEFFDYNCGYCKHAISDMDALIKANPEVRFVLKEFPILGEASVAAHKVSNAFRKIAPAKYGEFHRALLGGNVKADEARALEVAASLGVSEDKIRAEMEQLKDDTSVQDAYKLATELGISGTPSYILGNEAVFGAIGEEALSQKVANISQCGKTTC